MVKRYKPEWGYTARGCIEKPPLDDTKFRQLEGKLQAHLSFEDREELHEATSKFLMFRTVSNPPSLNKSKAAGKIIVNDLKPAINILKKIDTSEAKTKDRLCTISPRARLYLSNTEVLIDGLESILQAAELLIQKKTTDKDNGRPSKHSPLWTLIADLIPIFEKVTEKKATASAGQYSTFTTFVIRCIELVLDIDGGIPEILEDDKNSRRVLPEYSQGIINNATVEVISLLKLKDRQKRSIGDNIPLTETEEGMLKALHDTREKNEKEELDFIKNLKKR